MTTTCDLDAHCCSEIVHPRPPTGGAPLRDTPRRAPEHRLPLFVTEAEAAALVSLCAASPISVGEMEGPLFAHLGELLRSFRR